MNEEETNEDNLIKAWGVFLLLCLCNGIYWVIVQINLPPSTFLNPVSASPLNQTIIMILSIILMIYFIILMVFEVKQEGKK